MYAQWDTKRIVRWHYFRKSRICNFCPFVSKKVPPAKHAKDISNISISLSWKFIIQIPTKFLLWLKKTHLLYGRKHDTSRKKVWLTLVSRVLSTTKKIRQNTGGVTQWLKYILNLYRKRPQAQPVMIRRIFCGHVLERARTRFPPSPSAKPKGHKDPWKINLQIRIGQIFLLKKNTFGHFGPNLRSTNWDFERFFSDVFDTFARRLWLFQIFLLH